MPRFATPNKTRPLVVSKEPSAHISKEVGYLYSKGITLPGPSIKGKHVIDVFSNGMRTESPVSVRSRRLNSSSSSPTSSSSKKPSPHHDWEELPFSSMKKFEKPSKLDRSIKFKESTPRLSAKALAQQRRDENFSQLINNYGNDQERRQSRSPTRINISLKNINNSYFSSSGGGSSSSSVAGSTSVSAFSDGGRRTRSLSPSSVRSTNSTYSYNSASTLTNSIYSHHNKIGASLNLAGSRSLHSLKQKDDLFNNSLSNLAASSTSAAAAAAQALSLDQEHRLLLNNNNNLLLSNSNMRTLRKVCIRDTITEFLRTELNENYLKTNGIDDILVYGKKREDFLKEKEFLNQEEGEGEGVDNESLYSKGRGRRKSFSGTSSISPSLLHSTSSLAGQMTGSYKEGSYKDVLFNNSSYIMQNNEKKNQKLLKLIENLRKEFKYELNNYYYTNNNYSSTSPPSSSSPTLKRSSSSSFLYPKSEEHRGRENEDYQEDIKEKEEEFEEEITNQYNHLFLENLFFPSTNITSNIKSNTIYNARSQLLQLIENYQQNYVQSSLDLLNNSYLTWQKNRLDYNQYINKYGVLVDYRRNELKRSREEMKENLKSLYQEGKKLGLTMDVLISKFPAEWFDFSSSSTSGSSPNNSSSLAATSTNLLYSEEKLPLNTNQHIIKNSVFLSPLLNNFYEQPQEEVVGQGGDYSYDQYEYSGSYSSPQMHPQEEENENEYGNEQLESEEYAEEVQENQFDNIDNSLKDSMTTFDINFDVIRQLNETNSPSSSSPPHQSSSPPTSSSFLKPSQKLSQQVPLNFHALATSPIHATTSATAMLEEERKQKQKQKEYMSFIVSQKLMEMKNKKL